MSRTGRYGPLGVTLTKTSKKPPVDHAPRRTSRARRSWWQAQDGQVSSARSRLRWRIRRLSPVSLGGSLHTVLVGVRNEYLLEGMDMTERVVGAWMHEKMD